MANSLLDFVMALVRDPDAAAQYAANPAQAIADANLTDVTSADVNHLIPVVAESMSAVAPTGGGAGIGDPLLDSAHNIWASGAATAAFDAFDDHLPLQGGDWATGELADQVRAVANVVSLPEESAPTIVDQGFGEPSVPSVAAPSEFDMALDAPVIDEPHLVGSASTDDSFADLHHSFDDHQDPSHDPGFDVLT
ncbi:hypothetical protein TUM20983_50080 [Mycobacterium antarcticum]|uniref:Rv0340 family IniB-related protein n=1 Tax=Mycolicibacterium sp. TUM20983 TaxID=3023369 RepID=UPI002388DA18|nr:Rv0340 family IniB-related protein [Mycolicibacterium sp. TUM20983]GLP77898.1 hypothetical protein TUM20983_50080 [Mycolicibacterium sp. TUM20983]